MVQYQGPWGDEENPELQMTADDLKERLRQNVTDPEDLKAWYVAKVKGAINNRLNEVYLELQEKGTLSPQKLKLAVMESEFGYDVLGEPALIFPDLDEFEQVAKEIAQEYQEKGFPVEEKDATWGQAHFYLDWEALVKGEEG